MKIALSLHETYRKQRKPLSILRISDWGLLQLPCDCSERLYAVCKRLIYSAASLCLVVAPANCYLQGEQPDPAKQSIPVTILQAAQSTLQHHPLIRYQEAQIDVNRGLKQQASAPFDTVVQGALQQGRTTTPLTATRQEENALIGASGTDERTDLTQATAGASRLYRSGITLTPTVSVIRQVDNIASPQGVNTANYNLQIQFPLLRGRGRQVVAAQETAATIEVNASVFDLTNQISQLLTGVVNSYWNLVASQKLLAIAREAEDRARTDLENTQTLVNADQLPRENLNAVNAGVAQAAAVRISAEQSLIASRYQLALDMGLTSQDILISQVQPAEDFPNPAILSSQGISPESLRQYTEDALHNRSDYLALEQRIEEQKVLVAAAKNRLLPQLNLVVNSGFNGLQEGRRLKDIFTSSGNNIFGPNASAGLSYNFAPRNDLAKGLYLQTTAVEAQLEAQHFQLQRSIGAAVASAVQALRNAALEALQAHQAVEYYRASLAGQREKYHLGSASVIDVITVEERLTTTMTREVQAQQAYALALVQLRTATGTIIAPGQSNIVFNADVFRIPPEIAPARQIP